MGLAASQARFLSLTARKSNTEYQGQQINQARTALANQSAGLYNDMLELDLPTAPSVLSFSYTSPYTGETLSWTSSTDQEFEDALELYEEDKDYYDAEMESINAQTEQIQEQDKILELQLNQVDSEQQAIQTEIDSVKKVIDKNIELTFKTFA